MKPNRPLVLLLLAVLAPGLALCVLQYRSLVELEAKSRATARERLHEVLSASARKVESRLQEISGDALDPISTPEPQPGSELASRFAALRQAQPAIREIFVVSECACREDRFTVYSSAEETVSGQRLGHERLHGILRAYSSARSVRGIKYYQGAGNGPLVYAFRSLDLQHGLFAGLSIDARILFGQLLQPPAAEPIAFSAIDAEGQRLWASDDGKPGFEAEIRFGPPLADWTLQGRYAGTTVQTLAHRQFRRGAGLVALVVICLLFGTGLAARAAHREARAAALRSAFIANISHEMKTPLSLIRMFSETLELGRVSDPAKLTGYYQALHRESRKLTSLIENVLEFGRMEAGRKEYRMETGSVAEAIAQVMHNYEPQLRDGGFEWKIEIEENLPLAFLDSAALSQAAGNIVDNAMKYSAERKSIVVTVSHQEGEILIAIADSGIGIPAGEQERIFDRFYRSSEPLVHNTKGSGLGLAIARQIVEAHGGHIKAENIRGGGSRFVIALPALTAAAGMDSRGAESCLRS